MRASSAAAATLVLLTATGCRTGPDVVRLKDGHAIDGRFISAEAYASYLDGTVFEASGDDKSAAVAYTAALAEDPNSAGILARLGAVRCLTNQKSADDAFAGAGRLDPDLADAWLARAECDLRRGNAKGAIEGALRAAELSPNDVETSLVVARAFDAAGDRTRSAQWLAALALRRPGVASGERAGDAQPMRNATEDSSVDRALVTVDDGAAAVAQVRTHRGSADLAVRAVLLGRVTFGSETATRVLSAEPGNVDAKVAALAAADLNREPRGLEEQLTALPRERTVLGALAAGLMTELLRRRSGERAAQAWITASEAGPVVTVPAKAPNR